MTAKHRLILILVIGIILLSSLILIYKYYRQTGKLVETKENTLAKNSMNLKKIGPGEQPTLSEQKKIEKITLPQTESPEETQKTLENWIKSLPTYKFDGQNLALKETKEIANNFYRFLYNFETSHPGFGDRSKQKPEEKITPHLIEITAQNNRVLYALIDGRWDELEQKLAY